MKLRYVGPFEAVSIPELGELVVAQGDVVDVDDTLGRRMAESEVWDRADGGPAKRTRSQGGES